MGIINAHTLKYAWYGLKEFYESAKEELSDLFSSKTGITEVFDNGSQTHKILMLGGRRAGKSTILASIHNALGSSTPGSICTITDETDYSSIEQELPTLDNKRLEVVDYIEDKSDKKMFLVDMAPTQSQNSYTLRVNAEKTSIKLEFVDIPGEWMRKQNADYKTLKELTKETDVFVIVIDTPFLMLGRPNENEVYNRIKEITDLLVSEIRSANDADKKLFLICPVKCEKWVRQGLADDVTQKAKSVYKTLINTYVKHPWADIRVMPIQTVGGIESVKLLDALLY
ncbi:MAG: 50S ribosome-binding GTPase, partial [Bacteroidales bacterium]|nr:50S ribosome-binding GTPase [Bacteroidales bacterium]